MEKFNGERPIWIRINKIDLTSRCLEGFLKETLVFEGHQGHWADCYFSGSYRRMIEKALRSDKKFTEPGVVVVIREMNDEELAKYPEAIATCERLMKEYGEI